MAKAKRLLSAREAILKIKDGSRVLIAPGCGEPSLLVEALIENRYRFKNLKIYFGFRLGDPRLLAGAQENFQISTWHATPLLQPTITQGKLDYLPLRLSEIPQVFGPSGILPIDVILVSTSPPDRHGFFSLGVSTGITFPLIFHSPLVIAEINENMPRTLGQSFVHESKINFVIESDRSLINYRKASFGVIESEIARNLASLIPDGSTLQIGIGSIPEATLESLSKKNDLGIHSGMITDGTMELIEEGVINNRVKSINQGKVVTGEIMGSIALYEYFNQNPSIEMQPVTYTHSWRVIKNIKRFVALNSALEIDLSGQINTEMLRGQTVGAIGGLLDFVIGSNLAPEGINIFALSSTAEEGKTSRIVASLSRGSAVSVPRSLVHYVVTEYGVANLKGKGLAERAQSLIEIAHPNFRDELKKSRENS